MVSIWVFESKGGDENLGTRWPSVCKTQKGGLNYPRERQQCVCTPGADEGAAVGGQLPAGARPHKHHHQAETLVDLRVSRYQIDRLLKFLSGGYYSLTSFPTR